MGPARNNHGLAVETLDVLVVDDEPDIVEPIVETLAAEGHRVSSAGDGAAAAKLLDQCCYDLLICDIRLPRIDGLTLFRRVRKVSPATSVVLMTAYGSIPEAVGALQERAFHYLAKPFELGELLRVVSEIADQRVVFDATHRGTSDATSRIVGECSAMKALKANIGAMARSDASVLIHGESGTGKELVARAIHEASPRRDRPFVALNCAAFPDTLLEAELYGHERGAFTGADRRREGRFRAAHGGTLFLDEIFELPLASQAKLLRALQENTIQPLGSDRDIEVDVRILSATNVDLRGSLAKGQFREDLFYRLKVLEVRVPPLRDRGGDLSLLTGHFLAKLAPGARKPRLTPRALAALRAYPFPGNVRELEHALEHALVLCGNDGIIDAEHLPAELQAQVPKLRSDSSRDLASALAEFERELIVQALDETRWNRTRAAGLLGISRKNLWEKMKKHDITR